jgi:membrane protease YdiL (CAAX protease family)
MFGMLPAILVSGGYFALIHFLRGNLGGPNGVAGFLFAWAFLGSRSLATPVLFHASGNLLAVMLQIGLAQYFGYDWRATLLSWHGRGG